MVVSAAKMVISSSNHYPCTMQNKISWSMSLHGVVRVNGFRVLMGVKLRKPSQFYKGVLVNRHSHVGAVNFNATATDRLKVDDIDVELNDFVEKGSNRELSPDLSGVLTVIATVIKAAEKEWAKSDWKRRKPTMFDEVFRVGRFVEDSLVFRQSFAIRSYEVGPDRTASIEILMSHLQETALNCVWLCGVAGDGFGCTREMSQRNLIWAVSRTQIQVESYPSW